MRQSPKRGKKKKKTLLQSLVIIMQMSEMLMDGRLEHVAPDEQISTVKTTRVSAHAPLSNGGGRKEMEREKRDV